VATLVARYGQKSVVWRGVVCYGVWIISEDLEIHMSERVGVNGGAVR
jgi:hypothetical protein